MREWWGTEENDFAERTEHDFAWKFDFKTRREQAEAAAAPHRQRADQLNQRAATLDKTARELRESLRQIRDSERRQSAKNEIDRLRVQSDSFRTQARDAQVAADRLYWPIFNLDAKNPRTPEEARQHPEELLEQYKRILGEIEETGNRLKSELNAALAHKGFGDA